MADLEEMYPKAALRFKEDEAEKAFVLKATDELQKGRVGYRKLWEHFVTVTFQGLNRDFGSLGITYDHWYGESFYEDKMPPLIDRLKKSGVAVIDDGALVIRLDHLGENTPPLLLVKKDGGYLYATSDLATIEFRIKEWDPDYVFYVVDKRQSMHFKQVFEAAKLAHLGDKASLEHLAFGTMNGADGKPFKTRAGGVLKLNDVIQMVIEAAKDKMNELGVAKEYPPAEFEDIARKVGIATLKFSDLKNNRIADYIFDLDKFSRFEGYTGPYLLYAAVRIQSLLKRAEAQGLKTGSVQTPSLDVERRLILQLARFAEAFETIVNLREPHYLCQFGFDLSQAFNAFYQECHILTEKDDARRGSWLELCRLTHLQLSLVLGLLGIEIPDRM
jgi:arginyl-tRNA synthetase